MKPLKNIILVFVWLFRQIAIQKGLVRLKDLITNVIIRLSEGVKFTGLKYGLLPLSKEDIEFQTSTANSQANITYFACDQGVLLFCHGSRDGACRVKNNKLSVDQVFEEVEWRFPQRQLFLVSCYNGYKEKPKKKNRVLVCPDNKSPIIFFVTGDGEGVAVPVPPIIAKYL